MRLLTVIFTLTAIVGCVVAVTDVAPSVIPVPHDIQHLVDEPLRLQYRPLLDVRGGGASKLSRERLQMMVDEYWSALDSAPSVQRFDTEGTADVPSLLNTPGLLIVRIYIGETSTNFDAGEDESYTLFAHPSFTRVDIHAGLFWGARHALATLAQLTVYTRPHEFPLLFWAHVSDEPAHGWRGLGLDFAAQPEKALRAHVRAMGALKMNVLHVNVGESAVSPADAAPGGAEPGAAAGADAVAEVLRNLADYGAAHGVMLLPQVSLPIAGLSIHSRSGRMATAAGLRRLCKALPTRLFHLGGNGVPYAEIAASTDARLFMHEKGLINEHELVSWMFDEMHDIVHTTGRCLPGRATMADYLTPTPVRKRIVYDTLLEEVPFEPMGDVVQATSLAPADVARTRARAGISGVFLSIKLSSNATDDAIYRAFNVNPALYVDRETETELFGAEALASGVNHVWPAAAAVGARWWSTIGAGAEMSAGGPLGVSEQIYSLVPLLEKLGAPGIEQQQEI